MDNINEKRLQNYLEAEKKALISQEYQDGTQRNRRADLTQIRQGVDLLISANGSAVSKQRRSRRIVLRDL